MTQPVAPPQDLEAERAVLGAVLLSDAIIPRLLQEGLKGHMFYREQWGTVYTTMIELHAERQGVDQITLIDRLRANDQLDAVGGIAEVQLLAGSVPVVGNVMNYARIVMRLAAKRQLLLGAYQVVAGIHSQDDTELAEGLARLREAPSRGDGSNVLSPDDLADLFIDWYEAPTSSAITLPWPALTSALFGGLRRGDTSVWAGWPGMGKSLAGDQLLEHGVREHGLRCAAYVNEMGEVERIARHLAGAAKVSFERIMRRELTAREVDRVLKALGAKPDPQSATKRGVPYSIIPCAGWNVDRVCESLLYHRWDMAFVDRIDRVPNYSGKVSEWDQISGKMADVARQSGTHVHMALQLNRERATGATLPMPVKRDLRGTGAWEQDARNIFFVHRRDVIDKETGLAQVQPDGVIQLAKASNGRQGDAERVFLEYGLQRFTVLNIEDQPSGAESWQW